MVGNLFVKLLKIQSIESVNIRFWMIAQKMIEESELMSTSAFIQHGDTTVLLHSIAVAYYSYLIAVVLRKDTRFKELITGALFHDYFLYDWHIQDGTHRWHGFFHPQRAYRNALKVVPLTAREKDIITKHMFPLTLLPPRYFESVLVCMVDKGCSVYETLKRRGAYQKLSAKINRQEICGYRGEKECL